MKLSLQILAASAALMSPVATSRVVIRASTGGENGDTNVAKVCYPGADDDGIVPPCVSIANIEQACRSNGTEPIDFEAHAQCMCTGSFFMDWRGCQNCLFVHGFRSARDHVYWEQVVSAASYSLCHASPTAEFQSIFSSVQANTKEVPPVTTGESMSSDKFPGKTDVSLYYTATAPAPQGPGVITGAAAMATRVSRPSCSNSTSLVISDSSVGTSPTQTSAGPTDATSTKPAAASFSTAGAPAQGTGVAIAAIAGAALLMAL
ncbi:hypothetical protein EsDP_00004598 [Epichloe bromicola]|uniref:Collagen-like protein Mcl1 n=1 Tax=Epichloe bromicola TaxID=79588 RepID=A0ABQ0CS77_9HYPO